jgi:vacuolar protein-sorting-associated protein 4
MSTHFKKVMAPNRKEPAKQTVHYTPCSPSDPQGEEKSWTAIGSDELLEPELVYTDFLRAASTVRPSVNAADLEKYVKWTVSVLLMIESRMLELKNILEM